MDVVFTGDRVERAARTEDPGAMAAVRGPADAVAVSGLPPTAAEPPRVVLDSCARLVESACEPYLAAGAAGGWRVEGDDRADTVPAIAWLLDHLGYLRVTIRETREALAGRQYRALPRPGEEGGRRRAGRGARRAEPRIRTIARDIVAQCLDHLDEDSLVPLFEEAQAGAPLTLAELWAIAPMCRLALFELLHAELSAGSRGLPPGATSIGAIVTALHSLDELPWRELSESLCPLEPILRNDPAGVYPAMDFETRDSYRRAVERLARETSASEMDVAALAVDLATQGDEGRTRHIGYYLVGEGARLLEDRGGRRLSPRARLGEMVRRHRGVVHLGGVVLVTAFLLAALARWLAPVPWWYLALLGVAATEAALAIANGAAHLLVAPTRLPRLDFSAGIPDEHRTLVVVPALLLSPRTIDALVERLEINYLANRDRNLRFALLTDAADSPERTGDDEELGQACADAIRGLNERHAEDGAPFYLFHRAREWNATERVWMGYERKRGKLNALNGWLLGGPDPFAIKAGDVPRLGAIRYVITLDADTRLPLDAARSLVATAAHPLNRPVLDPDTRVVRDGYAILQPRVSVSVESALRSRLARIRGGLVGVDPYATAISDLYQDVYRRANFTGKGLYDLAAYHRALEARFPDNALLSHDLIEGEHARVGLVSDVELIDDYPRDYEVYSKRKHRWTRGDWQLLYWLLPRVPDGSRAWVRNPLSALSRWKIFDNLRRSVLEISIVVALLCAWTALPGVAPRATLAVVGLLVAGAWADALFSVVRLPPRRLLGGFLREKTTALGRAHADALISVGVALHQGLLMADAIARTVVRRLVTHRRLLEWETSAQAESAAGGHPSVVKRYLTLAPLAAVCLLVAAPSMRHDAAALGVAGAWLLTPWLARWLSRPGRRAFAWNAADLTFLRGLALRTWRHFDEWSAAAHHWLVPDTVQESPGQVACQASPTNIGLQLAATVAARDFGYLTSREMAVACARVLDTIEGLERYRGHFYNWYDTRTLAPLPPRYVSTVDSGNLCAALLAVKQGCLDIRTQPILGAGTLAGLRDHCVRVRNGLPRSLRRRAVARSITAMLRRLDQDPGDVFAWARLLAALRPLAVAVDEWLRLAAADRRARRHPSDIAEASAWAARLLDRVEEASRDLRRYAPWTEWPDGDELPPGVAEALAAVPAPAAADAHYEAIERQVREQPPSAADGMSWKALARLRRQVAAARFAAGEMDRALASVADRCGKLALEPDFAFLFDSRRKLLRLGCDADTGVLDGSSYDLLASEARTAVLLAIAKGDIPRKAWFHLGRKLTSCGTERVLVSWGGTMFEHLMPALFTRNYDRSLLDASMRAMVRIQQAHGRAHGVPWGFSEAAHAALDPSGRYGYRTFGVPAVAMRPMGHDELVVAPYAATLALTIDPAAALDNLRLMAAKGWIGRCGLYESVDYRIQGSRDRRRGTVVRSYMAHHHGMSLVALENAVLDNRMQRRFHAEPMVAAVERLLQERVPARLPSGELQMQPAVRPIPPSARVRSAESEGVRAAEAMRPLRLASSAPGQRPYTRRRPRYAYRRPDGVRSEAGPMFALFRAVGRWR